MTTYQTSHGERLLSEQQLTQTLALAKASDTVELKLTIPYAAQSATVRSLELDPLDAQIRQVFFFDTPDLRCNQAGVVVRARRVQRRADDTVVKLRPVVPDELSRDLRQSPNLGVEVDTMPGGFVCSASMKGTPKDRDVRSTVMGDKRISKLFTKEQRKYFAAHAPDGVTIDDLATLGPIFVLKLKFAPKDYKGRMVAELWLYPDARILELSTKCAPDELLDVSASAKEFLTKRGVDLGGEQQTKTKTALEFFSKELQATPTA